MSSERLIDAGEQIALQEEMSPESRGDFFRKQGEQAIVMMTTTATEMWANEGGIPVEVQSILDEYTTHIEILADNAEELSEEELRASLGLLVEIVGEDLTIDDEGRDQIGQRRRQTLMNEIRKNSPQDGYGYVNYSRERLRDTEIPVLSLPERLHNAELLRKIETDPASLSAVLGRLEQSGKYEEHDIGSSSGPTLIIFPEVHVDWRTLAEHADIITDISQDISLNATEGSSGYQDVQHPLSRQEVQKQEQERLVSVGGIQAEMMSGGSLDTLGVEDENLHSVAGDLVFDVFRTLPLEGRDMKISESAMRKALEDITAHIQHSSNVSVGDILQADPFHMPDQNKESDDIVLDARNTVWLNNIQQALLVDDRLNDVRDKGIVTLSAGLDHTPGIIQNAEKYGFGKVIVFRSDTYDEVYSFTDITLRVMRQIGIDPQDYQKELQEMLQAELQMRQDRGEHISPEDKALLAEYHQYNEQHNIMNFSPEQKQNQETTLTLLEEEEILYPAEREAILALHSTQQQHLSQGHQQGIASIAENSEDIIQDIQQTTILSDEQKISITADIKHITKEHRSMQQQRAIQRAERVLEAEKQERGEYITAQQETHHQEGFAVLKEYFDSVDWDFVQEMQQEGFENMSGAQQQQMQEIAIIFVGTNGHDGLAGKEIENLKYQKGNGKISPEEYVQKLAIIHQMTQTLFPFGNIPLEEQQHIQSEYLQATLESLDADTELIEYTEQENERIQAVIESDESLSKSIQNPDITASIAAIKGSLMSTKYEHGDMFRDENILPMIAVIHAGGSFRNDKERDSVLRMIADIDNGGKNYGQKAFSRQIEHWNKQYARLKRNKKQALQISTISKDRMQSRMLGQMALYEIAQVAKSKIATAHPQTNTEGEMMMPDKAFRQILAENNVPKGAGYRLQEAFMSYVQKKDIKHAGDLSRNILTPSGIAIGYFVKYGGALTVIFNLIIYAQHRQPGALAYAGAAATAMFQGAKALKTNKVDSILHPERRIVNELSSISNKQKYILEQFQDPQSMEFYRLLDLDDKNHFKTLQQTTGSHEKRTKKSYAAEDKALRKENKIQFRPKYFRSVSAGDFLKNGSLSGMLREGITEGSSEYTYLQSLNAKEVSGDVVGEQRYEAIKFLYQKNITHADLVEVQKISDMILREHPGDAQSVYVQKAPGTLQEKTERMSG